MRPDVPPGETKQNEIRGGEAVYIDFNRSHSPLSISTFVLRKEVPHAPIVINAAKWARIIIYLLFAAFPNFMI